MKRKYIKISSDDNDSDDEKNPSKKRKITLNDIQRDKVQCAKKLNQLLQKFRNKDFNLKNIFDFINETRINKRYVYFTKKDVDLRSNARLYAEAGVSGNPGLYCSLVHVQGELLKAGQAKRRLIPTERVRDFDRLKYWVNYFIEREFTLCVNEFIEQPESNQTQGINWLETPNIVRVFGKHRYKRFCLVGALRIFTELNVSQRFVHFDENDESQAMYFDDKTDTVGFFCNINHVKQEHANANIKEKYRIPKGKITNYLELIDYIMYLRIYDKQYPEVVQDSDPEYEIVSSSSSDSSEEEDDDKEYSDDDEWDEETEKEIQRLEKMYQK
jgi:hypothetical protein